MEKVCKSFIFKGHTHFIHSIALSFDDKYLVSGSHDNTIKVWDTTTKSEIMTIKGHLDAINCVAISPDNKYIASGSYDKTIKIWNFNTGQLIITLPEQEGILWDVNFNNTGKLLVSAGNDFKVRIWDMENFKEIKILDGHKENVLCSTFSPTDSNILVSGSYDNSFIKWEVEKNINTRLKQHFTIRDVRFTKDGKYFAFCGDGDLISIFETESLAIHTYFYHGNSRGRVWSLDYTPDCKYIATGGADDFMIRIWDLLNNKEVKVLSGHKSWISSVRFNSTGNKLYSGSGDNDIIEWNFE